jgi:translation initiation factor IF-3
MQTTNNNQTQYRTRVNQYIRVPQVRLIRDDNTSEILATKDALKMAQDLGLDLVEVNAKAIPPVVKIIDFGKFKYEEKKRQQAAKKNQQVQELKEITFRPNTDINDLGHKLEQAKGFLEEGDRVKFTIRFRGREIVHTNIGKDKLNWIIKELGSSIIPNPPMNLEGKFLSMIVAPNKNK